MREIQFSPFMGEIFYTDLGFILYWSLSLNDHLKGLRKGFDKGLDFFTEISG